MLAETEGLMSRPLRPCQGLFGLLFGHKYRARYDSELPSRLSMDTFNLKILEASKNRTYRGDICVRCGSRLDATPRIANEAAKAKAATS